jgi:hypothetical protein
MSHQVLGRSSILVKSRVLDHLQDAIRHRLIEQGKTPRGDNSPSPALWSCQRIES